MIFTINIINNNRKDYFFALEDGRLKIVELNNKRLDITALIISILSNGYVKSMLKMKFVEECKGK